MNIASILSLSSCTIDVLYIQLPSTYVVILKFMGLDHTYKVNDYFFLMDKKRSIFVVNFFDHHGRNVMMGLSLSMDPAARVTLKAELHQKKIVCLNFHVSLLTFPCLFFWIKLRKSIIKMLLFF